MMALTGHVATTVPPVGDDTHTVEYSDGELATDRDAERVGERLATGDATPPLREALTDGDAAAPPRDTLTDAVTLKPRVGDVDGDRVGDTSVHCTYSRKLVKPAQPPPADCVSAPLGVMEHEFCPKHVALTTASLVAAPGHEPTANGPDGHDPVGLP